jgi:DNA-binding MarR family transcriptional regulator
MMDRRACTASRDELQRRSLLATRSVVDQMRTLYRALEQSTGAPIAAHRTLASIGDEPGIAASRLAAELGMQRSATSHVLNSLESRGWIERQRGTTDRRSVSVHLTGEGRKLLNATRGRAVGTLQRAIGRMQRAELAALATGLEALLAHLPATPKVARSATKAGASSTRRLRPARGRSRASRDRQARAAR